MSHHLLKYKIPSTILAGLAFTLLSFFTVPAFSAEPVVDFSAAYKGSSLICSDDCEKRIPEGGIEAQSEIELLAVFNGDPNICSGPLGYKLFRTMAHAKGGDLKNVEYLAKGSGEDLTFSYNFNSGPSGQRNVYWPIFYCWSSSSPETALGTARQWKSAQRFDQDTVGGSCNLSNAKWGSSSLIVGKDITLSVDGTLGCKGRDFKFELWKHGGDLGSRLETSIDAKFPDTGTPPFTVAKTWKVSTSDKYLFKARVPDPNGSVLVSAEIFPAGTGGKKTDYGRTATSSLEFTNPLRAETFGELIEGLTRWIFWLGIPIGVIVIIYAGIMMMASGGDPAKFTKGKKILLWAVVGLAVLFIGKGFTYLIESIINLKDR